MIKRIKDLLSNFSNKEEVIEDKKISSLDFDTILAELGISED